MAGTEADDFPANDDLLANALGWKDEVERDAGLARTLAGLEATPTRKALILTCIDARIEPADIFGFDYGEVHVVRNAGGSAEAALRDIVISQRLLGTEEIYIVKHEGCGMLAGDGDDGGGGGGGGFGGGQSLMRALEDRLDAAGFAAVRGLGGPGLLGMQPGAGGRSGGGLPDEAARRDRSFLASHPAVKSILVWGLVYDPRTGAVRMVDGPAGDETDRSGGESDGMDEDEDDDRQDARRPGPGPGPDPDPDQAGPEGGRTRGEAGRAAPSPKGKKKAAVGRRGPVKDKAAAARPPPEGKKGTTRKRSAGKR